MMKLAIDIDEVLTPFLPTMLRWRQPRCLPKKYPYICRTIYDISEKESQKLIHEFYETPEFQSLKPIKNSQEVIKILKQRGHSLYIVTGRQSVVRRKTEDWVEKWYPNLFNDVILTNSYTDQEIKKSQVCNMLNIGLIIDDNFEICMDCISKGTKAINFIGDPIYPWCDKNEISKGSWLEIKNKYLYIDNGAVSFNKF